MKKMVIGMLVAVGVLSMGTVSAFAAESAFLNSRNFVDVDRNGICDNYEIGGNGQWFVDMNGDGVCDNRSSAGFGYDKKNLLDSSKKSRRYGGHISRGILEVCP